ncbi:MAG: pH regulation protein F [Clostridiaceae bacterium]|nr:pH regulation protein F [Clostridiaceae bacterium]
MMIYVAAGIISLLLITSLFIVVRGPSDWHRIQGLTLFSSKTVILIVLLSLMSDKAFVLDMALIYSLLGFIGVLLLARYVSKRRQI